jgi:hypothetical protein
MYPGMGAKGKRCKFVVINTFYLQKWHWSKYNLNPSTKDYWDYCSLGPNAISFQFAQKSNFKKSFMFLA